MRIQLHAGGAPLSHATAMVDTDDHWGEARDLAVTCVGGKGGTCDVVLPPLSFTALRSGADDDMVEREAAR